MAKNSTSKRKRKLYYQWFPIKLSSAKFSLWCFPPMGSAYWVIAVSSYSDSMTLYLNHFHQSHSYMQIKEVCITGSIPISIFIAKVS